MRSHGLFFILSLFVPAYVFGATTDLPRTLTLGVRGEDVRTMQIILNRDPETRIAETGAGSPGNETDYFGLATKRALIKFQEKYRAEVLIPIGLAHGTGVAGFKTLAKLKAVDASKRTEVTQPAVPVEKGDVLVMFLSQYSGKPGTTITIKGEGFTRTDNTIYFGTTHAIEKASSWNGQDISFNIPAIPKGLYHLSVKNAHGESDKDAFFVITDGVTPEPRIDSVTLSSDKKEVTIHGSGFTATGNMIRMGVGVQEKVSSTDGTMITIPFATTFGSISDLPKATMTADTPKGVTHISIPVWVAVVNENGVSNNTSFTLEL